MEERLIEVFCKLLKEGDRKLTEILWNDKNMVEERRQNSFIGMVVMGMSQPCHSRRDSLNELREMVKRNASLNEINRFLNSRLTSETKNDMIIFLAQHASIPESSDDDVTIPVKIQVIYDNKWISTPNSFGPYEILLSFSDEDFIPIYFRYKIEKLIYMWFLLHPRQLMTKRGIWCPDNDTPTNIAFANERLRKLADLMFPENCKNPIREHTKETPEEETEGRIIWDYNDFDTRFSGIKNGIHRVIEDYLNGMISTYYFDIQEENETPGRKASKRADNAPSRYLINLRKEDIIFPHFTKGHEHKDLTQCRMPEDNNKYEKVDE